MSLQFRGSFAKIAIWRGQTRYSAESPGPYGSAFFNSLTSAIVTSKYADTATLTVTIDPNLSDGFKILKSGVLGTGYSVDSNAKNSGSGKNTPSKVQQLDFLLEVTFMYPGETLADKSPAISYTFYGNVTKPILSLSSNSISIEIDGLGASLHLKQLIKKYRIQSSALEAVEDLADEASIDMVISQECKTILSGIDVDETFKDIAGNVIKQILSRSPKKIYMSDGVAVQTQEKRSVYLHTEDELLKKEPKYEFVLYRQVDTSNNIMPIYNYSYKGDLLFRKGNAFGIAYEGLDRDTKLPPETETVLIGDELEIEADEQEGTSLSVNAYVDNKNSNANEIGQQTSTQTGNYVEFEIETPGIPDIKPQDMIKITIGDGIPALSGVCMITELTHKWDGTWISSIKARTATDSGTMPQKSITKQAAANKKVSKLLEG